MSTTAKVLLGSGLAAITLGLVSGVLLVTGVGALAALAGALTALIEFVGLGPRQRKGAE
jgi:hypothetical protein